MTGIPHLFATHDRDIILGLASNRARAATRARVHIDRHAAAIRLVLMFGPKRRTLFHPELGIRMPSCRWIVPEFGQGDLIDHRAIHRGVIELSRGQTVEFLGSPQLNGMTGKTKLTLLTPNKRED